jgi:4-amino-4-deoxy-L-arabinose transferase-like glycosyltransferase
MDRIARKGLLSVPFLVLLCAWLFTFDLGRLPLTDPDETFYAETAKEMVSKGEWVTPTLFGKPQFEKPILFYWLTEISFKIFGVNELSARIPSAVFGTLGVIFMYLLGSVLFSRRCGLLSALALATCVEYFILARACITDMVLTVLLLGGFLAFFYGYTTRKDVFYVLSAVSFALAVLTKGPAHLLLAGLTILVFLAVNRDMGAIFRMPLWQMILAYLAVSAPWYVAIYRIHGKEFVDAFFGFQNVNRFLTAEHKIGSQVYYNIPILFGGFFPWSVFLPFGIYHMVRNVRGKGPGVSFALIWLVVIFGFFTASSTKLPTYIFPCFISAALIVGALWDDFLKGLKGSVAWTRASYYLLVVIVGVGSVAAPFVVMRELPCAAVGACVSGAFLAFGILLSLAAFVTGRYIAAFLLIVYALSVFIIPVNELVLPSVERYETSKEVSLVLAKRMKPGERLGSESNYLAGLAFYTGVFPSDLDRHHNLAAFMNSPDRVWTVMKEKNHRQLYDPAINETYVIPSYVVYRVGKRSVVTNRVPEDGRYIMMRKRPDK